MRKTFIAAIIAAPLAAGVAAPAFAQEYPAPFTGGHIEVIGGVDRAKVPGGKDTGALYGIAGGYDFQTANGTLFGIEGEVADASTKECTSGFLLATDRLCVKAKRDLYAGGRLGFVTGSTLVYGKVGYTNARIGATYEDGTTGTVNDFSNSRNLDGVRFGGGLEKTVGAFTVKAEYRYSNYEDGVTRHQGVVGAGIRF